MTTGNEELVQRITQKHYEAFCNAVNVYLVRNAIESAVREAIESAQDHIADAGKMIPVMGEPVAWMYDYLPHPKNSKWRKAICIPKEDAFIGAVRNQQELFTAPTNSIPAAELEQLRKDAERYRRIRDYSNDDKARRLINWHCETDLDHEIDAAIAAGRNGEKE